MNLIRGWWARAEKQRTDGCMYGSSRFALPLAVCNEFGTILSTKYEIHKTWQND
jgi:hypothetical protein